MFKRSSNFFSHQLTHSTFFEHLMNVFSFLKYFLCQNLSTSRSCHVIELEHMGPAQLLLLHQVLHFMRRCIIVFLWEKSKTKWHDRVYAQRDLSIDSFSLCFTLCQVSSWRGRQRSAWSPDCLNGPSGFQAHVYPHGSPQLSWPLLTWVWTQHTGTQRHQRCSIYTLLSVMLQSTITCSIYRFVPRPHIPISKLAVSESYDTYISRSFQVTREILSECKNLGKVEL